MNTKVTARARITYRILCITLQITFAYQKHCHGMGQRTQEVSSTLTIETGKHTTSKFPKEVFVSSAQSRMNTILFSSLRSYATCDRIVLRKLSKICADRTWI